MNVNPDDVIPVSVNGWMYPAYLDEDGVQRFIPNEAVSRFVDGALKDYSRWIDDRSTPAPSYTLNDLAIDYLNGEVSLKEKIDLYVAIGYSISGFCDVFADDEVEIINPLWNKE